MEMEKPKEGKKKKHNTQVHKENISFRCAG